MTLKCTTALRVWGSLANKDTLTGFMQKYQQLLKRQFYHVQESTASLELYNLIQKTCGMPEHSPKKGLEHKWIGFAESESQDADMWPCKTIFWEQKVANRLNGDHDAKHLAGECCSFYGSSYNRMLAAGGLLNCACNSKVVLS